MPIFTTQDTDADPDAYPESATRDLIVKKTKDWLANLTMGVGAIGAASTMAVLQKVQPNLGFEILGSLIHALLTLWIMFSLLKLIPNRLYEPAMHISKFSLRRFLFGVLVVAALLLMLSAIGRVVNDFASAIAEIAGLPS